MAIRQWAWVAVTAALITQLATVWQVQYLPTQDGPIHVYNASLPIMWPNVPSDGTASSSPRLLAYYESRDTLASWVPQRMLGALVQTAGPARAEQVLVSAYLLLMPCAAWWVVSGLRRENSVLAVLAALFSMNFPLAMGFYPFCLSLVASLAALGCWVRPKRTHPAFLAVIAGLLVLCDLLHPFGLVAAGVGMGSLSIARASMAGSDGRLRSWLRSLLRDWAALVVAAAPALYLFVRYLESDGRGLAHLIPGPGRILLRLTTEPEWIAYSHAEWLPVVLGAAVPLALAVRSAWRRWLAGSKAPEDGLALAAALFAALYVALPDAMAGGAYVGSRFVLWLALCAALWAAAVPQSAARRDAVALAAAAAVILLAVLHGRTYRALDPLIAEHVTAVRTVPPHATLVAFSTADRGDQPDLSVVLTRPRPFAHAAARVGTASDVVLLVNYQAERGHFPVRFRPDAITLDETRADLVPWDAPAWPTTDGRRAGDYVLVWGPLDPGAFPGSHLGDVLAVLERDYELVFVSQPRGLAHVWRRRP
jgi:hypothetical protein